MGTTFTVFIKEVVDNIRDRRTLMSALLMGPIFGPLLFAFVINLSIERSLENAEQTLELPVIGAQRAPNLVSFLRSRNIDAVGGPADLDAAMEAVKTGEHDVILVIPEDFAEQLAGMTPALVRIVSDQANRDADRDARRLRGAVRDYGQLLSGLRIVARGVNPRALQAINIDEVDVSTPSGRSAILLGMMSYFFIFASLMGGMYLAIDTTAGERERGSLEPLLSLPVTRSQLIFGKIAATCLFMALSMLLSLTAFYFALGFMPLEQLGMTPNFGVPVVLATFLIFLPFVLLGSALMTLVASFTKSYREAQTWLSVVLLAPTLPILVVSILMLRPRTEFMFIPSLSQHLLLVDMVKNEPINALHVAISVLSTLFIGIVLTLLCARLYRREGLLG
ncbi:MAG: ABC transporter permease [Woeseiaceae bacterium]|nr:ABC transporter permease [Woeseiaceae bacterium]NNL62384.1 ABC transporter permease [Woeseiaceae bacterium]